MYLFLILDSESSESFSENCIAPLEIDLQKACIDNYYAHLNAVQVQELLSEISKEHEQFKDSLKMFSLDKFYQTAVILVQKPEDNDIVME